MADVNLDDVLAQARPKTVKVGICLRGDLLAEHDALEAELAEAQRTDETENRHAQAPEIAARIRELEAEIDAAEYQFTLTAIGQKAWTDLITRNPASEEDREQGYAWDPVEFPKAALMASGGLTEEQIERLYEVMNFAQWNKLVAAVLDANVRDAVPFSAAASAILRGSETKRS